MNSRTCTYCHPAACAAAPAEALAATTLRVEPGAARVRILPAGEFDAPRGALAGSGPWRMDAASASALIARNRSREADIAVDYEHQTLLSPQNGLPAPAAGWIDPRSLEYVADGAVPGLYAAVKWVGEAAQMIAADQYRYLSPVFSVGPGGTPLDVLHVALTNFPAIDAPLGAALAARSHPASPQPQKRTPHVDKDLIAALGLPEDADKAAALSAVAALKARADSAAAEIVALKAAAPDPSKYAPVEAMAVLQTELAALKGAVVARDVGEIVEAALTGGRLVESQRAWAEQLGRSDLAALKAYIAATPALAALAGTQSAGRTIGQGAGGGDGLSVEEREICRQLDITPADYLKQREGK